MFFETLGILAPVILLISEQEIVPLKYSAFIIDK